MCVCGGGGVLLHHGGVLTNKESPSPLECIIQLGRQRKLLDQVKSGRMCETALLGLRFLAFRSPRDFPNLLGSGKGRSTIPIQVKLSCLRMIKIVLALMYAHLF